MTQQNLPRQYSSKTADGQLGRPIQVHVGGSGWGLLTTD